MSELHPYNKASASWFAKGTKGARGLCSAPGCEHDAAFVERSARDVGRGRSLVRRATVDVYRALCSHHAGGAPPAAPPMLATHDPAPYPEVIIREEAVPGAPATATWHGPYDLEEQHVEFARLVHSLTATVDREVRVYSVRHKFPQRSVRR